MLCHGEDVFVTTPTHIHTNDMIVRQRRGNFHNMGQRVTRFERRDDTLELATQLKRLKRFFISDADVLRPSNIV